MKSDKFTFFWNGPFSQWYHSTFREGKFQYNCAEQYMMSEKALLFNDEDSWFTIMKAQNPREQKALGRSVKNFDIDIWNANCMDIVMKGNYLKFSQNEDLYNILIATEGELVEASPYDKIWGIGLSENDPLALDKSTWKGENRLGIVLTRLRDFLKKREKPWMEWQPIAVQNIGKLINLWR